MPIKSMSPLRWTLMLIVSLVLSLLLYSFAQMATAVKSDQWIAWIVSVVISAVMIGLYYLFVILFENHQPTDIPWRKIVSQGAKGFGIGAAFFTIIALVMMAFGLYRVQGIDSGSLMGVVHGFFFFIVVAVGEEIIFRGVFFRWIDEKWGFWPAIIVSALAFGFMHIAQPGGTWWSSIAIAIEAGLLIGAAYKWSDSLWVAIGIHWAWNFFQGNVFGLSVSGMDAGEALLDATVSGPDILTGGVFGPEASVITAILGLALSVFFIYKVLARDKARA